jgi:hypothetical protein
MPKRAQIDPEVERRLAEEQERIARQRAVFDKYWRDPEHDPIRLAMLRRAYEILVVDRIAPEAADALLEFLPEEDAQKLLDLCFETEDEFDEAIFE